MRSDRAEGRTPELTAEDRPAEEPADESDRSQIVERLHWRPRQRLEYLVDMIAFEERARRARKL